MIWKSMPPPARMMVAKANNEPTIHLISRDSAAVIFFSRSAISAFVASCNKNT